MSLVGMAVSEGCLKISNLGIRWFRKWVGGASSLELRRSVNDALISKAVSEVKETGDDNSEGWKDRGREENICESQKL